MAEETWNETRLIPTSGINGADEQERRATSALLAVMGSVKELGRSLVAMPGEHPTTVDKKLLRRVALHHWSWTQVLSEAVMQKEHRGVADPDQAWILGELIRYLEHPRSGALELDDMGASWVRVRDALHASTLRPGDQGIAEVTGRFDALLRFASLQLGRRLGTEVTLGLTRKEFADPALRRQALADGLVQRSVLEGSIRIPDAVAPLYVTADLRSGQVTCHVDIDAPREGRPTTRVNWLVRQLKAAPDDVRVEATAVRSRGTGAAELLKVVREHPASLVEDPLRELKSFRVAQSVPLGTKRGRGRGAFIDSVPAAVDGFYGDVLQHLKAWSATPPKMRDPVDALPPGSALDSNALSSQDGAEEPTRPVTSTG